MGWFMTPGVIRLRPRYIKSVGCFCRCCFQPSAWLIWNRDISLQRSELDWSAPVGQTPVSDGRGESFPSRQDGGHCRLHHTKPHFDHTVAQCHGNSRSDVGRPVLWLGKHF